MNIFPIVMVSPRTICVLCSVVTLAGCGIEQATKTVKEATGDVKDASKNLKDGAESLSQGMDKLDPVALKKLLDDNQSLRNQLIDVTKRVEGGIQGTGAIQIENRNVIVNIARYTGSHRLNGWVDDMDNWFWKDRGLDDKDIVFPLDVGATVENGYHNNIGQPYAQFMGGFRAEVTNKVGEAFRQFLHTTAIVPGPEVEPVNLNTRFGGAGRHLINIEVTPVAADRNGRWSMRFDLLLQKNNGERELIEEVDFDSTNYANHPLGTALPAVHGLVNVKTQ
jgi:hypothetical protein